MPGEPAWTRVADMNIGRGLHGTVTDGISNIWVIGGCNPRDCWPDGFIEHYNVTNNTWTKLTHVPNLESYMLYVEVCSFWRGYIYVIFSEDIFDKLIPRFHIYNTRTGNWQESNTELILPIYWPMYATVPDS